MNSQIAIAVGNITPSKTHIQELRRTRFDKKLLDELAASIKSVGVLQPVVVRKNGASKFELVAGERRWLGAKIAGLKEIPATVHDLTDEQVLEVQLIENLQRENLHELEEAEGYEELMKLKGISADAVADMVGRSRSYVFKRTKLLALCPEARKAFYAGTLEASKAFLIARIVNHDMQREALKDLQGGRFNEPLTYRESVDHVQRNYMLQLKQAPFDITDKQLVPKAGSCNDCPKRTGNQKELFADVKSADVCTDPPCFYEKIDAHHEDARKKVEATGKKVIHGDAARKIFPHYKTGGESVTGEYLKMNDEDWSTGRGRKVRDIVGADYNPIIVQHPTRGTFIELATRKDVAKAAQKPGAAKKSEARAAERKQAKGPDVDEQLRARLVKLIYDKAPSKFNKQLLLALVAEGLSHFAPRHLDVLAKQLGLPANAFDKNYRRTVPDHVAKKMDDRDMLLLLLQFAFLADDYNRKPILDLFGISEQKTREVVIAERKKAAADERAARKAAKASAKSKSKPKSKARKP